MPLKVLGRGYYPGPGKILSNLSSFMPTNLHLLLDSPKVNLDFLSALNPMVKFLTLYALGAGLREFTLVKSYFFPYPSEHVH